MCQISEGDISILWGNGVCLKLDSMSLLFIMASSSTYYATLMSKFEEGRFMCSRNTFVKFFRTIDVQFIKIEINNKRVKNN